MDYSISPYKGDLVNLLLDESDAERIKKDSLSYPAITLTQRQQCDLELLVTGALPLAACVKPAEAKSNV